MEETSCAECGGNAEGSEVPHISDLCSADKKRIAQLVEALARCTQEKYKAESELSVSKSENEALRNRYGQLCSRREEEKNRLKSQLSDTTARLNKMKLHTARSLQLLTRQIQLQEAQFVDLAGAVKEMLREKVQLRRALIEKESRLRAVEAKTEKVETRKSRRAAAEALAKGDRATDRPSAEFDLAQGERKTTTFERKPSKEAARIKSKRDLDALATEAILLRELFFERPNVVDMENLGIFPVLPEVREEFT